MSSTWFPRRPSEEFRKAVLAYRYVTPTASLLERLFLNAFWERLVVAVPKHIAPNTLTVTGTACCVALYLFDWLASPAGQGTARPTWLYASFALLLLVYQTLDGLDGKQARRTKSGSALGEIMDHGLDALVTGPVALVSADTFGFGLDSWVTWISVFGSQMAFFTSNLTLLHRGSQKYLNIDILELQWGLMLCWIVTGIFGPQLWRDVHVSIPAFLGPACEHLGRDVFGVPPGPRVGVVELRFLAAVAGVGGTVANYFLYTLNALAPYFAKQRPAHILAAAPGVGLGRLGLQFTAMSLYGVLAFVAVRSFSTIPDPSLRHDAYRALLVGSCFAFGDQVSRLLVMRVAHHRMPFLSPMLVLMAIFAIGSQLNLTVRWWWAAAALCIAAHQLFFVWTARTLARILGIRVFRIARQD